MSYSVLIVDDSAAIRKIIQRVLLQAKVPIDRTFEASDGNEALEILRQETVGLILSDIFMPNMDGLELLSTVRSHPKWKDVPVLIISTDCTETKVMQALRLGATGYVRKPFTADQIKDKLASLPLPLDEP